MRTMTDADKRVAGQLELAKRARGFTNETLAVAIGRPGKAGRNWVQQCCSAVRPVTIGELEGFSIALDVPVRVLTGDPAHLYRYLGEHPELHSDQGFAPFGCTTIDPGLWLQMMDACPNGD
jgi:hypothetical protein